VQKSQIKKKKSKKKKVEAEVKTETGKEKMIRLWKFLKKPENEGMLKHLTRYSVKMVKWLLPRRLFVNMEVGFEDPQLTGYIAGVASIIYVATKKEIHIKPNFQEEIILGKFKVKGRLYLYQLLYYIIRLIVDRRIRRLVKEVRA